MDYSVASLRNVSESCVENKAETATIIKTPERIQRTFDEWLEQGYVHADGITKKFLSRKTLGEIDVFEVEEFLERKSSYVVKRGDVFSHGETVEKAIADLRYKIADRDTSRFDGWKLDDEKSVDEIIQAYRTITGACSMGTKKFVESQADVPERMTIKEAVERTKNAYGNAEFEEFFSR